LLKEESFINLAKEVCTQIGKEEREAIQIERNLKSLKLATKYCAKRKKKKTDQDLINTESSLQSLYDSDKGGFSTPTEKRGPLIFGKENKRASSSQGRRMEEKT
jgi:hypothetical protein